MKQLATLFLCWSVVCSVSVAQESPAISAKPKGNPAQPGKAGDLAALMAQHKPPYVVPAGPLDPAITFDRVDVLIERGFPGPAQTPYLSIGRDGSYLYKINELKLPGGKSRPPSNQVERLWPQRLTELQRILEGTKWLTAPGGEGAARHTDADRMTIALTRDGKTTSFILEGNRPAPYSALQKFFYDLALQEHFYYRLTRLPEEQRDAVRELHNQIESAQIESALGRPGRQPQQHDINFARYHDLFAGALDRWYTREPDELRAAVDLMLLLKRDTQVTAIARLRFDRDSNLRTAVARALPLLSGQKAIPWLADMVDSTAEARLSLIGLGEPAVPTIVSLIEPATSRENQRSVGVIRAYIDHWKTLPQPIDRRVVQAVIANMQQESVRNQGVSYHRELLKLAGEPEPKDPTALETARSYLKHLQSGNKAELQKIVDNTATPEGWLTLRELFAPESELVLDKLFVAKTSGLVLTKPFQDKAGNEIRLVVFMNLVRNTDWRVGPALAPASGKEIYQAQFLKSNPDAKETLP